MRKLFLATIAAAALLPGVAQAQGSVRVARGAQAGTTWSAPHGSNGMREEYRRDRDVPLYGDEEYRGDPYADPYGDDPYYDDARRYGVEDYAMSDRFVRDGDGGLDYDRDYPYDHPYGNGYAGGGYYTIVETTTTTEPGVVTYLEQPKVAVHRARRTVKKRGAYRASGRGLGTKIRRLR